MKQNMNLEDFFEAMSYPFEEMTDFESKKYVQTISRS